ncbi:hypothetical protein CK203_057875 [Vitis vinifera]|uniref:Uncharacterized protein n=1 Tax=Vitis vinifera TaxID=29760 RepID=A0A438GSD7_VITVI|nr:hypothetical protein CK203_057875 [Vitis vinifera]
MTTLHRSNPSLWRRAEGCIPPEDPSIRTSSLHVGASEGLQSLYSHSLDSTLPLFSLQLRVHRDQYEFEYGQTDLIFVLNLDLSSWIKVEGRLEALASLKQEISSQQSRSPVVQDETLHDSLPPPSPLPVPTVPQASPYMLHGHYEIAPPTVV